MLLPITELPLDPALICVEPNAVLVGPAEVKDCNEYELLALLDLVDAGRARIEIPSAASYEGVRAVVSTVFTIKKIKSRSKKAAIERGRIVGLAQRMVSAGWARPLEKHEMSWVDGRLCDCLKLTRSVNLARSLFDTPNTLTPWRGAAGNPGAGSWAYGALAQLTADGWIAGALIASESLTPEIILSASTRSDSFFSSLLHAETWQAIGGPVGGRQLTTAWMDKGWNINAVDALGQTSLHRACKIVHFDAITLLLELGAHVALGDSNGRTPLHVLANGCASQALKCGELLIQAGADPFVLDQHGQSAYDLALASNSNLLPLLAPLFAAQSESRALASSMERADAELGAQLRALMHGGHRLLAPDGALFDTPSAIMKFPHKPVGSRRPGL